MCFIAVADKLVQEGRNIRLRFAGDGPDRAELQRDVNGRGLFEQVCFEGNLNQDQLRALYRECAGAIEFCRGSAGGPHGGHDHGNLLRGHGVAGVPELIRDKVDGLLVPAGDVDALAAAIARLESDPVLRQRLGWQARQRASEKVDLLKNVGRLAQVFQRRLGADVPTGRATLASS